MRFDMRAVEGHSFRRLSRFGHRTCMIPLKMRRLFFGFTPRRLLGINGSILAHCPSLNQNKFARICWPPVRLTNPLNLNMVNWVLTLRHNQDQCRSEQDSSIAHNGGPPTRHYSTFNQQWKQDMRGGLF